MTKLSLTKRYSIALFDHAQTGFANVYNLIPFYAGLFSTVELLLQAYSRPDPALSVLLGLTMLLSLVVGLLGFGFHLSVDLAGRGAFVWSRLFYQAPALAPLLFCDLAIWGVLVFLDPLSDNNHLVQRQKTTCLRRQTIPVTQ